MKTEPELQPLVQLFRDPEMLASFEAHGRAANSRAAQDSLTFKESLSSVWVYAYAPKLLSNYQPSSDPYLLRNIRDGKDQVWADIQMGLLTMLMYYPKAYACAQQHCEAFRRLEALPAMGWRSFDHMLNDKIWSHTWEMDITWRRRRCFKLSDDQIAFIYVLNLHNWEYYRERIELKLPKRAPRTFGEEIRVMQKLLVQVASAVNKCDNRQVRRGIKFYQASPPEHRHWDCKNLENVPVATWHRRKPRGLSAH